jgi:hypothetical protein
MKYFLIVILTLWCSLVSFSQSRTKLLKDTINIKVPLDKQISPSKVRELLNSIVDKKEILSVEPVFNANPKYVEKGNNLAFPYDKKGGMPTAFTFRVWRGRNMESFDFVVSKNSDLSSPTHVFSSISANPPITGLDSNFIYFWKYRAKNASFTGAWSNTKRFDTFALPIGGDYKSIFDLEEFVPFVTRYWENEWLVDNVETPLKFRIGSKQMFNRHVRGTVASFPFTVQTDISQIIATYDTSNFTEFSWGKDPTYLDINPYLSLSGNTLVLSQPPLGFTTFPISKIYFYVNIFYLK